MIGIPSEPRSNANAQGQKNAAHKAGYENHTHPRLAQDDLALPCLLTGIGSGTIRTETCWILLFRHLSTVLARMRVKEFLMERRPRHHVADNVNGIITIDATI
jgi:hypothetical protein